MYHHLERGTFHPYRWFMLVVQVPVVVYRLVVFDLLEGPPVQALAVDQVVYHLVRFDQVQVAALLIMEVL
jgi:hypothetical protein